MSAASYSFQGFVDVANRRTQEARALLDVPKKHCDGAVVCALLAGECALKALLFKGYGFNELSKGPASIQSAFKGKSGHHYATLWAAQHSTVTTAATDVVKTAISYLNALDRYIHRYGSARPQKAAATIAVQHLEILMDWMKSQVTQ